MTTKSISSSELRTQIKRVLNEVEYGRAQYIVEKFGEPTAVIVSLEDFRLLESAKRERATSSLREAVAGIRARSGTVDPEVLNRLIEEARDEFHQLQGRQSDAS